MNPLLLLLLDATVKGTILLLIAAAAAYALRRAPAATRHLVWSASLICLLALPALLWLPGWSVPIALPGALTCSPALTPDPPLTMACLVPVQSTGALPWKDEQPITRASRVPPHPNRAGGVTLHTAEEAAPSHRPAVSAAAPPLDWASRLLGLWAVGAVAWLLTIGLAMFRLRQLTGQCITIDGGPVRELNSRLAAELGIRRPIRLLQSFDRTIPMTWGIFRTTLLLPAEAATWSREQLRMVLLHELAHVARFDSLTHLLGHIARCLYWFHPLVWWALSRQRQEQEKACDDLVLTHGASAHDYAEHLLTVTAHLPAGYFASALALGMARSARLQDRLTALLDGQRRRQPATRRRALAAAALALVLMAPAVVARPLLLPPDMLDNPAGALAKEQQAPLSAETLKKFEDIRKKLHEHYVTPLDDKKLIEAAIKGLLDGLQDPYTDYLPADELGVVENQSRGTFVGIGVQLKQVNQRLTVVTPIDQSPAHKAGLRPGDVIESIDGHPTHGVEVAQAVKRIIGNDGSVVKLKVAHVDGVVEDITVKRAPIRIASVQGLERAADGSWRFSLDGEHQIGYVRITQFNSLTTQETQAALKDLRAQGLKGLILDLRYCPGGLLDQAVGVCKLLLTGGDIVKIQGAGKNATTFNADGKDALPDNIPMVVLINEATASAAEIVAGALRDHKRAVLVGSRTFGKGSVQAIVKLDDGGALKVTTAFYHLPGGRNIQKRPGEKAWGVDPTEGDYVPLSKEQRESLLKSQMDRAMVGRAKDEQSKSPDRITPKLAEERYADPQLAAALRTMVAKLTGGDFLTVGQSNALMQDQLQKLEDLRQRRETMLQNLRQLERDIDALAPIVENRK